MLLSLAKLKTVWWCCVLMIMEENMNATDYDEHFKEIEGFSNYLVSNRGNIFSKERIVFRGGINRRHKERILKKSLGANGYLTVCLSEESNGYKRKTFAVHRLVATAFIPNPNGLPTVNHKDLDKTNNNVWNLEWVTRSDNSKHYYNGRKSPRRLPVNQIKDGVVVKTWECVGDIFKSLGIRIYLYDLYRRKTNKAGFTWKYL
jgi:NUMOD4 motif/HNH endonuclease